MTRAAIRPLILAAVLAAGGAALAGCEDYPPPPPPGYGPPPPPPPGYRRHVRRCFRIHPDYNPRTNTFIGADGYPHPCEA